MKSKFLLVVKFLFLSTLVSGQIEFGVKGGINIANEKTKYDRDKNVMYGRGYFDKNVIKPYGGIYGIASINNDLAVEVSLVYNGMGYIRRFPQPTVKDHSNYDYLSLPMSVKIKPAEKVGLFVGPYVSYLLGARQNKSKITTPYKCAYDVGLQAGIQFMLTDNIGFGLGYIWGMINTDEVVGLQRLSRMNRAGQLYVIHPLSFQNRKQKK